VHVVPIRTGLLVSFDPSNAHRIAVAAAFYEIAARGPTRLVLAYPGRAGGPDRYEIFNDMIEGLRRVEAALDGASNTDGPLRQQCESLPGDCPFRHPGQIRNRNPHPARSGAFTLGLRTHAEEYSKRLSKSLDGIAPEDEWLGQTLSIWRSARIGRRLPSRESFDILEAINIARGRAHLVDTRAPDPEGYRFRLWGSDNSYRGGRSNITLAETPAGLLRQLTMEDYSRAVATGVPNYQLIHHIEDNQLFSYARLLLPLAANGRRVDQLVVLINERRLLELEMSQGPRPDA
jgi:hypothetical protein